MAEYHELDKMMAVFEERMASFGNKLDYLIDTIDRSNATTRRDIERIDKEIVALKIKVYGFGIALPIVLGVILKVWR